MAKQSSVIVLDRCLVLSTAWLSLTGAAPQVYTLFRTKCQISKRYGKPGRHERVIMNNGEIEFTYLEAEKKYGISKDRFTRALDQLIDRGFIDVAATGMGVHKVKTLYTISERWRDYGTSAFCKVKRPEPSIANPGFKRGNKLSPMAFKKKSSDENARGSTRENPRGDGMTTRENPHGELRSISTQVPTKQPLTIRCYPKSHHARKPLRSIDIHPPGDRDREGSGDGCGLLNLRLWQRRPAKKYKRVGQERRMTMQGRQTGNNA